MIFDKGRRARPRSEAVEALDQARPYEHPSAVPTASCPAESVKLLDQGGYFFGVEQFPNLRSSRTTRYLA